MLIEIYKNNYRAIRRIDEVIIKLILEKIILLNPVTSVN